MCVCLQVHVFLALPTKRSWKQGCSPWDPDLGFKHHSPTAGTRAPWRMAGPRAKAVKVQNEPGLVCGSRNYRFAKVKTIRTDAPRSQLKTVLDHQPGII